MGSSHWPAGLSTISKSLDLDPQIQVCAMLNRIKLGSVGLVMGNPWVQFRGTTTNFVYMNRSIFGAI